MKITVKNNTSYTDIESNYELLNKSSNVDLYIPANLSGKQLGIYTEIIQLIITWSRVSSGKLYINYNKESNNIDEKIDLMFNRFWNFVAGCMGYKNGIYLSDNTNISNNVATVIKKKIDYLNVNRSWNKGSNSLITAIQHSAKPFPSAFYYSNGNLKSKKEIIELTKDTLIQVSTAYSKSTSTTVVEYFQDLIGEIVFELIENTHFWSQSNFKDVTYQTGIRGLMISFHHGNKAEILKNCKDDKALTDYFSNLISNIDVENHIIELSIFDSGSGLASKWLKKDINEFSSNEEKYNAIIDCLIKGNTSDLDSNYERGLGLYNIMKLLDLRKGFLKVRSNGLKLFRDFNKNRFNSDNFNSKDEYHLNNWHEYQNKKNPEYKTEGTMFSIFLPTSKISS